MRMPIFQAHRSDAAHLDLPTCQARLTQFSSNNPNSRIETFDDGEYGSSVNIVQPWGDDSLATTISNSETALFDALNAVALPERYSALYHLDTKDIEILFTAFPLGRTRDDLPNRKFVYSHRGKDISCEYAPASTRLLIIAKYTHPVAQSVTNFRNISSFNIRENRGNEDDLSALGMNTEQTLNFWIKNVEWDESDILALMRELNFYMYYYDRRSPLIQIHSPKLESNAEQPRPRFREGKFPEKIVARELDEHLLRFWGASITGDPASRFLYSFRIVEYASVLYLESGAKDKIRRHLSSPTALNDVEKLMESMLSVLQGTNLDPPVKFEALIRDVIQPDILWTELNRSSSAFYKGTVFDGGFSIDPLVKDLKDAKQFGNNGITAFTKRVRDIRNALAHGRDQKSVLPLTPTSNNLERLQPWASIMEFVAAEVIVYRNRR